VDRSLRSGIGSAPPGPVVGEGASLQAPDSLDWRKSSLSNSVGCLEYAADGDAVLVRDSKHRGGPVLRFSPLEWQQFVDGARRGEFDLPAHLAGGGA
jgi:Domain of unknown function (DUF397)